MNETDRALSGLDAIQDVICNQGKYIEECVHSKIIRANIFRKKREFENAVKYIAEAEEITARNLAAKHPLVIQLAVEKIYLEADQSSFEEAKKQADQTLKLVQDFDMQGISKARAYLASGYVEGALGNYNNAIEDYQKAFNSLEGLERVIEVKKLLTQAHNNIGIAYRRLGDLEKAMNHYQSNLDLVKETFGEHHLEMGYAYNSIGTVYFMNGDFGTAAEYFQQAADIFRVNFGENSSAYAAALNNTGSAYYTMNDLENAAKIFEKAQRIKENTLGRDHEDTAVGYANLAAIYEENGDYNEALENQKRSISVRKAIHGSDHPSLVAGYIGLGKLYITLEKYELARQQFFEAERIIKLRLGEKHPNLWETNNNIALTYNAEKKYNEAVSYYQKVLSSMLDEGLRAKSDLDSISFPYLSLITVSGIGDSSLDIYKETGNISALKDAHYFLSWATDVISKLQTGYQRESSKINLIDQNYSIYTHFIEACNYLYQETSAEKWLEEIFRVTEMSRSRIALELLKQIQARSFAGIPDDILEKESAINSNIADYYQKLHAEQEKGLEAKQEVITAYRDSLFNSRQELNYFTQQLEADYPEYYRLKYDQHLADQSVISDLLEPDETLVNYTISEEQVYALVMDKQNISFHSLGSPDSLSNQIQSFREAVLSDNREKFSEYSYALYQTLLAPIESVTEGKSLIIVPDQSLYYLPFEMLLTGEAEKTEYYKMPFLIRDTEISYVPSATVLEMLSEQKNPDPKNLFAVAPFHESAIEPGSQKAVSRYLADMTPLPLTAYEIREIAEVFDEPQSMWEYVFPEEVEILTGRKATKSMIENTAYDDYGFIHFATHAFVNEEDPALSGIAFWGDDEDGNGIIYVNDIYNMDFNADLVTLGACETGLGKVYKGEGMIGFTRAFIYAGAANLLVSMWKVNDQPTANLMIHFYRYVKEGHSYSKSLQMAKMDLINQPEFASPRHWAAFILQGR